MFRHVGRSFQSCMCVWNFTAVYLLPSDNQLRTVSIMALLPCNFFQFYFQYLHCWIGLPALAMAPLVLMVTLLLQMSMSTVTAVQCSYWNHLIIMLQHDVLAVAYSFLDHTGKVFRVLEGDLLCTFSHVGKVSLSLG